MDKKFEDVIGLSVIVIVAFLMYSHVLTAEVGVPVITTVLGYIFRGVRNGEYSTDKESSDEQG